MLEPAHCGVSVFGISILHSFVSGISTLTVFVSGISIQTASVFGINILQSVSLRNQDIAVCLRNQHTAQSVLGIIIPQSLSLESVYCTISDVMYLKGIIWQIDVTLVQHVGQTTVTVSQQYWTGSKVRWHKFTFQDKSDYNASESPRSQTR